MKRLLTALLASLLAFSFTASAQNAKIQLQKRKIAALEQKIAEEERKLSTIQRGKARHEERVRALLRKISSRNQLLEETEKEAAMLREELKSRDSLSGSLSASLEKQRAEYARMVREAYRNYRQQNYITYIFSARDFEDVARKLTTLREVGEMRQRKMKEVGRLSRQVDEEKRLLEQRKAGLDSVLRKLSNQRAQLQSDMNSARADVRKLSQNEKAALQRKMYSEQQLDAAINELRKLTKGNKQGSNFSHKTTGLRLPVEGGSVKRYKGNMAEITGGRGAAVIAIYDGKVVEIKQNHITGKYDVFVAHGEYITSYANLGTLNVEKNQSVKRNAKLGTVGSSVNIMTMQTEYRLIFGIFSPNPNEKMSAASCFKK